jgi:segregation and condensation protein B
MEKSRLKSMLESLIFVAENPLRVQEMHEAIQSLEDQANSFQTSSEEGFESEENPEVPEEETSKPNEEAAEQLKAFAAREEDRVSRSDIGQALEELTQEYAQQLDRGILLTEVANGWQFRTRPENALVIRQLYQSKPIRLSKPSLETMAIVAYRQPITRVEIDEIRGVDSGGVLKTLLEKNLVRIVGKKDEPGRPMIYGTTQEFLELFQLKSLKDLPTLKEFRELEEEFRIKEGSEGVVVENIQEEDSGENLSLLSMEATNALEELDEEEEEIIEDLEASIKELRQVEQEIFSKEKEEGTSDQGPVTSDS